MSQIFRVDDQLGGGVEHISIDKDTVDRGDVINWTATDLVMQLDYRVGIYVEEINHIYNPIRFVADSKVKTGQYTVPNDIPYGQHKFVLQVWEEFYWRTTDYKTITVSPGGGGGGGGGGPPSLTIPTWVLIVIGVIVVIFLIVKR